MRGTPKKCQLRLLKRLIGVCSKASCLDGKIQFRGVVKKMIVRFTGVNKQLFFLHNNENGVFGQTLFIKNNE